MYVKGRLRQTTSFRKYQLISLQEDTQSQNRAHRAHSERFPGAPSHQNKPGSGVTRGSWMTTLTGLSVLPFLCLPHYKVLGVWHVIKTLSSWHVPHQSCDAVAISVVLAKLHVRPHGTAETRGEQTQENRPVFKGNEDCFGDRTFFKTTLKWKSCEIWKLAGTLRLMFYTDNASESFNNTVFVIKRIMDEELYWLKFGR